MAPKNRRSTAGVDDDMGRSRQDGKYLLAMKLYGSLLHSAIVDAALDVHASVARQRRDKQGDNGGCWVCGEACQGHEPRSTRFNGQDRSESASQAAAAANGDDPSGSSTPSIMGAPSTKHSSSNNGDRYSDNPFIRCIVCNREVGSNRYAPHLAKCCGMNSGNGGKARRSKNGATAAAAAAASLMRGSKLASALEARKRMGAPGSGNSTPVGGLSDSEDAPVTKKSFTLAEKLGLNNNGKRGSSSPGGTSIKIKKPRTMTPDVTTDKEAGLSRSNSSTFTPSNLGSAPVTGSPLNPKRSRDAAEAHEVAEALRKVPGKRGRPRGSGKAGRSGLSSRPSVSTNGSGFAPSGGETSIAVAPGRERASPALSAAARSERNSASPALSSPTKPASGSVAGVDADDSDEYMDAATVASQARNGDSGASDSESDVGDDGRAESEMAADDSDASSDDEDSPFLLANRKSLGSSRGKTKDGGGGVLGLGVGAPPPLIQRSRGSDGEWIDVESASEQSDGVDDF